MTIPPSVNKILPSLKINDNKTAILDIADLKALLPSLELSTSGCDVALEGSVKLALADLRKVLMVALSDVRVDEAWYLSLVPELRQDISEGKFSSVAEHYYKHGYLEGKLPEKPHIDEKFYLQTYPDIKAAIKARKVRTAFEHFVRDGYAEGRRPSAADQFSLERSAKRSAKQGYDPRNADPRL